MTTLQYEVVCVATEDGWRYRIDLCAGRLVYRGERTYAHYRTAYRTAKRLGVPEKVWDTNSVRIADERK